jgi:hypothetical protein
MKLTAFGQRNPPGIENCPDLVGVFIQVVPPLSSLQNFFSTFPQKIITLIFSQKFFPNKIDPTFKIYPRYRKITQKIFKN